MVEEEELPGTAALSASAILGDGFLVVARGKALPKISLGVHFGKAVEHVGRVGGKLNQNRRQFLGEDALVMIDNGSSQCKGVVLVIVPGEKRVLVLLNGRRPEGIGRIDMFFYLEVLKRQTSQN